MEEIIRFQKYMLLIRRAVGWSAEEFGERIGVTRQTINNLEKNNRDKYKLNKTQYIAMRSVLDAEIIKCPEETEVLRLILDMLIDNPEKYKEEEKQELLDKTNLITPSIMAGTATREEVSKEIVKTMSKVLGCAIVGGVLTASGALPIETMVVGISTWLKKLSWFDKK